MGKVGTLLKYAGKITRREIEYRSGQAVSASLELTHRCNQHCAICSIWKVKPEDVMRELSLDDWLRVVDELSDLGFREIGLIGGEPTIVKDFVDIMKRIKQHGMNLSITTNAVLLSRYIESFGELVDTLYLSVDAADERHDKIRGLHGALERTVNGASQMVAYKRQHNQTTPQINMHATITRINANAISDLVMLGDEIGVDVVSFQYISCSSQETIDRSLMDGKCVASERFTTINADELLLDNDDIQVLREQTFNLPKTQNCVVVCEPLRSLSDQSLKTGNFPTKRCPMSVNRLVINPYGDTIVCAHITGFSMGNVKDKSIRNIWNSPERKKLMNRLQKRLFNVCKNCCGFSATLTPSQLVKIAMGKRL